MHGNRKIIICSSQSYCETKTTLKIFKLTARCEKSNDTSHFEVQILGLVSPGYKSAPKAGDAHLSPGWGTNISHATRHLLTL